MKLIITRDCILCSPRADMVNVADPVKLLNFFPMSDGSIAFSVSDHGGTVARLAAYEKVFTFEEAHRYIAHDEDTLIMLSPEGFVYTYLPNHGWTELLWNGVGEYVSIETGDKRVLTGAIVSPHAALLSAVNGSVESPAVGIFEIPRRRDITDGKLIVKYHTDIWSVPTMVELKHPSSNQWIKDVLSGVRMLYDVKADTSFGEAKDIALKPSEYMAHLLPSKMYAQLLTQKHILIKTASIEDNTFATALSTLFEGKCLDLLSVDLEKDALIEYVKSIDFSDVGVTMLTSKQQNWLFNSYPKNIVYIIYLSVDGILPLGRTCNVYDIYHNLENSNYEITWMPEEDKGEEPQRVVICPSRLYRVVSTKRMVCQPSKEAESVEVRKVDILKLLDQIMRQPVINIVSDRNDIADFFAWHIGGEIRNLLSSAKGGFSMESAHLGFKEDILICNKGQYDWLCRTFEQRIGNWKKIIITHSSDTVVNNDDETFYVASSSPNNTYIVSWYNAKLDKRVYSKVIADRP